MGRRNQTAKSTQRYLKRTAAEQWRTAIYARLSDENNGFKDERSLQNQIKYLEEYIHKKPGLELVDRYADNGSSGTNFERREFKRMMEDVKDGRINCIVVKDLSRFGRNHIEAGCYLERIFPCMNVRFISVNDGFDSADESKKDGIIMPLKNMINEIYAKDTQRKVLASLRAKEKKGERAFWAVPYGYRVDPDCSHHLLPDEKTADYVRLIFKLKAEGLGSTAIADRLNQICAPAPLDYMQAQGKYKNAANRGGWSYKSIQRILKNLTYTGATVYNISGKGEYRVIYNTHEPLTDKETFEAAAAQMAEKSRQKKEALKTGKLRAEKYPNILKGLFFCGSCGHAMLYDRTGNTKNLRNFRYRCSGYGSLGKNKKNAPLCAVKLTSVPKQAVFKFILDQIRYQLKAGLDEDIPEQLFNTEIKEKKKQISALKNKEAGIKQKLLRLYEDYTERMITEKEYADFRKNYSEKIKNIRKQIESAENKGITDIRFSPEEKGKEIIQLTDTSRVEITADDKPGITERLLRLGLTRELAETMLERIEYNAEGSYSIKFKFEDYFEKAIVQLSKGNIADSGKGE